MGNVSAWVTAGPVTVAGVTKYYHHGGSRVAMRQGAAVHYLHGDHLGSTSLTTDATGAVVAEGRYLPYGGSRWTSGSAVTDFGFTGQRNEAGFGLHDYNARYYSSSIGRFITADSVVPNFGNPQSLNRYSYVYNNALKYTDPSGHYGVCISGSPLSGDPASTDAIGKLCDELSDSLLIQGGPPKLKGNLQSTMKGTVSEIIAAKAANPDERVTILGYSWGGAAALELATMLDEQGIMIDDLILIDPVYVGRKARGSADEFDNTFIISDIFGFSAGTNIATRRPPRRPSRTTCNEPSTSMLGTMAGVP